MNSRYVFGCGLLGWIILANTFDFAMTNNRTTAIVDYAVAQLAIIALGTALILTSRTNRESDN